MDNIDDRIFSLFRRRRKRSEHRIDMLQLNTRKTGTPIFYIMGYGSAPSLFMPAASRLKHPVFGLTYPDSILSGDADQTLKTFELIDRAFSASGDGEAYTFGTSLGSFISVFLASRHKRITRMILSVGGASVAETVWNNPNMSVIRHKLERKYSLSDLKEKWADIEPGNLATEVRDRKILIYESKTDILVRHENQKALTQALSAGNQVKVRTSRMFGHYITAIRSAYDFKEIQDFYDS